jgi:CheY-like chemotaxis protein
LRSRFLTPDNTASLNKGPYSKQTEQPSLRILIADDNVANQLIISKMLIRLGQRNIAIVSDGKQAVDVCRTTRFDLILMDIQMPAMNGWEATRHIRALGGTPTNIVALTANASTDDRKKCFDVGMDGVVTKPIQISELVRTVDGAVELYHNRRHDE